MLIIIIIVSHQFLAVSCLGDTRNLGTKSLLEKRRLAVLFSTNSENMLNYVHVLLSLKHEAIL